MSGDWGEPARPAGITGLQEPRVDAFRPLASANEGAGPSPDQPPLTNLLGMDNPARLSRAEFRVCLMLSRLGLVEAVARELGLSESTVRSHLHSIYAKTGSGSLAELVRRLAAGRSDQGA